ncbi:MAG: FtsX-like permease family protein [Thermoproteota archaeon]
MSVTNSFVKAQGNKPNEIKIDLNEIRKTVDTLINFKSRFSGYDGFYKTTGYILNFTKSLGLPYELVNFTQVVPLDTGSYILVGNQKIRAYSLYPNFVALGPNTITGNLVYVKDGSFQEINGLNLNDSIALINFNSGKNWINLLQLGVKAFIFIEPNNTNKYEALSKISSSPLNIIRVYVTQEDAKILLNYVGKEVQIFNNIKWENVIIPDILIKVKGEEEKNVILLVVHYDSASVVPSISPGANDAVNVAYALELLKSIVENNIKPKNSIWFLFVGGHYQALSGPRMFVEKYLFNNPSIGTSIFPYLAIGIDISDGSPKVNPVVSGYFYSLASSYLQNKISTLSFTVTSLINSLKQNNPDLYNIVRSYELDSLTGFQVSGSSPSYPSGFSFRYILDTEPFEAAGLLSFSFVTLYDLRNSFFTPGDISVNYGNVIPQIEFINYVLSGIILSPIEKIYSGSWSDLTPTRIGSAYTSIGFSTLNVVSVVYDPTKPGLYSVVNGSIVTVSNSLDPFSLMIAKSNSTGVATFYGLRPATEAATTVYYSVKSFVLSKNNEIIFAPDSGIHGSQVYPRSVSLLYYPTTVRTVLFKSSSIVIPKIIIPNTLQAPYSSSSLFASSNSYSSVLMSYAGYETPIPVQLSSFSLPNYAPLESWHFEFDPFTSNLVFFAPTNVTFGLVVRVSSLGYLYGIFVNYSKETDSENGYYFSNAGSLMIVDNGLLGVLHDSWLISEERYKKQISADVINPVTMSEITTGFALINSSVRSLLNKDFSSSVSLGVVASGFSLKAYSSTLYVLKDAVGSVIITFALAIPFILLFTSLVYGLTRGYKSIMFTFLCSALVSLALAVSHPGFKLVANVPAIFVGVLLVSLVIPALVFLFSNFSEGLSELRKKVFGEHFLERSGFDVSLSAVTVSVGNMRKRPLRTILTLTSIVLISFALASLTSFSEVKVFNVMESKTSYPLNGILIKTPNFYPLDKEAIKLLPLFLTNSSVYFPRFWVYFPASFQQSGVPGTINVLFNNKSTGIYAAVGINTQEILEYSYLYKSLFKTNGSLSINYSLASLQNSVFIPYTIAGYLNSSGDLRLGSCLSIDGIQYILAGVYNETEALRNLKDADGFSDLLPIDYSVSTQQQSFSFSQMSWSSIVIVNSKSVEHVPEACLTSVFIPVKGSFNEKRLINSVESLFTAYDSLNIYLVSNGTVYTFSKRNAQSIFGFQYIIIPLIIAGLITMSTVLGGIMERVKESMIYSSVGLAPLQIGYMFLTENVVYAIVGGVLGYLLGLLSSHYLRLFGILENVGINYSSSSVIISIGIVIALVLLASIYPIHQVALLITPSLERKWRITTKPKGDEWEVPIPFRVKEEESLLGLIYFLKEYLWNKRAERTGSFTVEELGSSKEESGYSISAKVWLAPYEQDIHQEVFLNFTKSKTEQRYITSLKILRISGPYESWVRFNYSFVDEIRKQLLVWNLMNPEQSKIYIQKAKGELK